MKKFQIDALKTTGLVVAACVASFIVHCVQMAVLGEGSGNTSMMNPFISGFLHASPSHFLTNIVIFYLLLLPQINRKYDFIKIFVLTTFLSFTYLPISLSDITQPAIGISGTWCFLAARFFHTRQNFKIVGLVAFWTLFLAEAYALTLPSDGVAHIMHLFGLILGYASLKKEKLFEIFKSQMVFRIL